MRAQTKNLGDSVPRPLPGDQSPGPQARFAEKHKSKRRLVLMLGLLIAMSGCASNNITSLTELSTIYRQETTIGPPGAPEPNITRLVTGPRNMVYGCTEENGWLFVLDPVSRVVSQWNGGRKAPGYGAAATEGDITDITVWQEGENAILLACQAYPAEIYRYVLPLTSDGDGSGVPINISGIQEARVYENPDWHRVHSIGRDESSGLILAGSMHGQGAVIASHDGGLSWEPLEYLEATQGLDPDTLTDLPTGGYSVSGIYHAGSTWFICHFNSFVLEDERGNAGIERHYVNGVFLSQDDGATWELAQIHPTTPLPAEVQAAVDADRAIGRLPEAFYGLVGERMQSIIEGPGGRLYATTAFDYEPDPRFGGRVYSSSDGGRNWEEIRNFEHFADAYIQALPDGALAVGTLSKTTDLHWSQNRATAELWVSKDMGETFTRSHTIAETHERSRIHSPFYVIGIASIAVSEEWLVLGTVNEAPGAHGELVLVPLND